MTQRKIPKARVFDSGTIEVLTFNLQGETFALDATIVQEVLDRSLETPVPGAPSFVDAVINFRGKIIPLGDLRLAFGLAHSGETRDSRVIVIEYQLEGTTLLIGLRADKVHEVTTIDHAATEAAPRIGLRWRQDFIEYLVKRNDDVIVFPNLANIFAARGDVNAGTVQLVSRPD